MTTTDFENLNCVIRSFTKQPRCMLKLLSYSLNEFGNGANGLFSAVSIAKGDHLKAPILHLPLTSPTQRRLVDCRITMAYNGMGSVHSMRWPIVITVIFFIFNGRNKANRSDSRYLPDPPIVTNRLLPTVPHSPAGGAHE